ncbi:MAG: hypothetical protein HYR91_02405 [Flavobacteriia bacterium]|nr:hypothetical protein [Flavobacteriia bacterium]
MENQILENKNQKIQSDGANVIINTVKVNLPIPTASTITFGPDNPDGLFPPSPIIPDNYTIYPVSNTYIIQTNVYLQNTISNPQTSYTIEGSFDAVSKIFYICYKALAPTQSSKTMYSLVTINITVPQSVFTGISSFDLVLCNYTGAFDGQSGGGDTPAGTTSRGTKTIAVGSR